MGDGEADSARERAGQRVELVLRASRGVAAATGLYRRVLATPQLPIEGNHRTGALIMSYVLARQGKPPSVLSVDNAVPYFQVSAAVREITKGNAAAFFRHVALRRRVTEVVAAHADRRHLLP